MPKNKEDLTPRQKAFCQEYLKDLNATQAAIRAGYKESGADDQGPRLLGDHRVSAYIASLMGELEKARAITPQLVLDALLEIAKDEETRPADRIRAWELIGKHLGMWRDQAEQVTQIALILPGAAPIQVSPGENQQVIDVQAIDWTA